MTLIEMTITVFLVSALLFLLMGWMEQSREGSKESLAIRQLADLDNALARYRRATGSYPLAEGPDAAIAICKSLIEHPRTHEIMEALPGSLWQGVEPMRRMVDPWGTPLRYLPPDLSEAAVIANSGRPIFVSAGPDRDFGDDDKTAIGDNLRSDDPGPDGFRLQEAIREALDAEEPNATSQPTTRPGVGNP